MNTTETIEKFREFLAALPDREPQEPEELAAFAEANGFAGLTGELLEEKARDLILYPNPTMAMIRFLNQNLDLDQELSHLDWHGMAAALQTYGFTQLTGELLSATCYRRGDELSDEELELVGGGYTPGACTPTSCSAGSIPVLPTPRPTPRPKPTTTPR